MHVRTIQITACQLHRHRTLLRSPVLLTIRDEDFHVQCGVVEWVPCSWHPHATTSLDTAPIFPKSLLRFHTRLVADKKEMKGRENTQCER